MPNESSQPSGIGLPTKPISGRHWGPGIRTTTLSGFLVVASGVLLFTLAGLDRAPLVSHPVFGWWAIALVSMIAESVPVNLDIRRETYTFTLNEVPMVIGLLFARPLDLVVGRLLGELVVLVVKERQHPRKLLLNLSTCFAGSALLLTTYRAVGQPADVHAPSTWAAVLLAVVVACLVSYVTVGTVLRWHGSPSQMRTLIWSGLLTLPVNTALGLTASVLLVSSPWSTLLLTSVVAFLMGSYRAYSRLAEQHASLTLLHDFTRLVTGARNPDAVLEAILEHSRALLLAERAEIWLLDDGSFIGLGVGPDGRTEVRVPPRTATLLSEWFGNHPDAIVASANDRRTDPTIAAALRARHCVIAPITEAGTVIGLIAAVDRIDQVEGFRARDAKAFTTLAAHASAALENGRLIDRLHDEARTREHEALHDPLTGLPNRVLFGRRLRDELDAADRGHGSGPIVGLMDLDDFKLINDTLGHHWGDHSLIEVARRLSRAAGPAVTIARLGGDEFALLVPSKHDIVIDHFARRLRDTVVEPIVLGGQRVTIGISIGLASYDAHGVDSAVLMRRADAAMYRAKQSAKLGEGSGYALAFAGEGLDV